MMQAGEQMIWRKFLDKHRPIGTIREEPTIPTEQYHEGSAAFQKTVENQLGIRPDAVIEKEDEITFVEVRKEADLRALGQLLAYKFFYQRNIVNTYRKISAILVCEYARRPMREIFKNYGIKIYVV